LTLFYDGKFTTYTEKDGLINNMVNVICEDSRGRLWIGSYVAPSGGITVLENGKFLRFSQKDGLPHSDITSIVKRGECVWIGTGLYNSGGAVLATIDDGKLKIVDRKDKQDGLAGEKVRTIFIDSHENTWFGSEYDGLVIFHKNGKKRMLTTENGLCNQEVKCIVEDRKGFFWIGTRNGITKIDRKHEQ
jgi:ligand-binding sensor domain-containing protein